MSGVYADFFERYFPNLREYESNCRPELEAICAAREPLERRWNLRSGGLRTFPTKVPSNAVLVNFWHRLIEVMTLFGLRSYSNWDHFCCTVFR